MAVLTLRCAMVGQRAAATVEVDSDLYVGGLKNVLTDLKQLECSPLLLRMFVAHSTGESHTTWLKTTDADYEAVVRGDAYIATSYLTEDREMAPITPLSTYFTEQPDLHTQTIHVLVRLPDEKDLARWFRATGGGPGVITRPWKTPTALPAEPPIQPPVPELWVTQLMSFVGGSVASWTRWMTGEDATNIHETEELKKTKRTKEM